GEPGRRAYQDLDPGGEWPPDGLLGHLSGANRGRHVGGRPEGGAKVYGQEPDPANRGGRAVADRARPEEVRPGGDRGCRRAGRPRRERRPPGPVEGPAVNGDGRQRVSYKCYMTYRTYRTYEGAG